MKQGILVTLGALLLSVLPTAHAMGVKGDVYAGYSRAGANMYGPYLPGMNGWQVAGHVKPIPFVGIEADVSHYGSDAGAGTQHSTLVMGGPRVTVGALGFSAFAHGLVGNAHYSTNAVASLPAVSFNTLSYALGGGVDIPVLLGLKIRATGDYLRNNQEPPASYSPNHYRFGVGLAYHF